MIGNIFESIIESLAGKIVVVIVSVIIMFLVFMGDEDRKNKSQRQEQGRKERVHQERINQERIKFNTEEQRKRRDKEFEDIMANPSVESIEFFIAEHKDDKRVGKLKDIRNEILRKKRENSIWSYISKTEKPEIDSLFVLKEITNDSKKIKKVKSLLMNRFYEETINRVELYKIQEFENEFPSEKVKIANMYRVLEKLYFQKFNYNKTHWSALDYLETIPDTLQIKRKDVLNVLKEVDSDILDLAILEDRTFFTDPISIVKFGSPMIIYFGKSKGQSLEVSLSIDDKYYQNTIAMIQENNLTLYMIENDKYFEFATMKYYAQNNSEFIETNYNSKNGYFRLTLKE